MNEIAETQAYQVVAAANSALELAAEGLAMFEERRPDIVGYGPAFPATGQQRIKLMRPGALERRAYIGAQAFISNVVIVQDSLARLTKIPGLSDVIKQGAKAAHDKVQGLVDRRVRHTIEHIDQRAADTAGRSLVSCTFLEGDLLCSTRDDGSVGRWRSPEKSSTRWRRPWMACSGRRKPWTGLSRGRKRGRPIAPVSFPAPDRLTADGR